MDNKQTPRATYRLQFSPQFRFHDALQLVPYLDKLGISHIYASPITRPRTGSLHGYDVCDPREVNPELGTTDELMELLVELKQHKMGWIQDIVPNHMAFSHENPFLVDVMESGMKSRYANFFDIYWNHPNKSLRGKLLIPFLGKYYYESISDGELKIVFENGGLWVAYFNYRFPLSLESYQIVLGKEMIAWELFLDKNNKRPTISSSIKTQLQDLYISKPQIQAYLNSRLNLFSTGTQETNSRFNHLMSLQNFKLALWSTSAEELNYRRFFAINDLIGIRTEQESVFEGTHAFILNFIEKGLMDGLRIDHIDGLYDPEEYLKKLRKHAPHAYIVVEKILGWNEELPQNWAIHGTSGYEFLNTLNTVFCDNSSEKQITNFYKKFSGENKSPAELGTLNKLQIIDTLMGGDIDNLTELILTTANSTLPENDITFSGLKRALVEIMIHFQVYRTYISPNNFSKEYLYYIYKAIEESREATKNTTYELRFLEHFLTLEIPHQTNLFRIWLNVIMRLQQFTGALMAKGIEDTMFYVYNRHIALNEVGGQPTHFGISLSEFHKSMYKRSLTLPHSLNATSTHDTKRGEDSRVRLQVLTEMAEEWEAKTLLWSSLNKKFSRITGHKECPTSNEEYLFYQALIGSFPINGILTEDYLVRIKNYIIKAIREAKVNTTWEKPNNVYEAAFIQFINNSLNETGNYTFMSDFKKFVEKVTWFGMLNSFSQTILKITLPGIPDFYRGTEHWDLSLVDPDNRRPANFSMLQNVYTAVDKEKVDFRELLSSLIDGRMKMFLTKKCLDLRKENPELFTQGNYIPITTNGIHALKIIAFQRNYSKRSLVVIVPRFFSKLYPIQGNLSCALWQDTIIEIPASIAGQKGINIFTNEQIIFKNKHLISNILNKLPFAIFLFDLLE